ncbi:PACE efflux transporter [Pseudovibrio sp. Ad26]|uniref:PACE efflux transporter n=1 Tax=Pseudovibrio sp. Ad26 TaxID=989410 RepID=UPI0007B2063C|nr:PACE efflux transporter [Pseudovibrio sp. Ad26]KZL14273.1 Bacterial Transmembrane Pair family protein [Pseudovibrio sp. Ad26]
MRSFWDRVRHSVLFEGIALSIVAVFGSWITGHSISEIGVLGLVMSLIAMGWNFLYNWLFDKWYVANRGTKPRTVALRIVHALLFEGGLLGFGIVAIMWLLQMNFVQALLLDIGFAVFFLVYAFVYNWVYDLVFPVPVAKAV